MAAADLKIDSCTNHKRAAIKGSIWLILRYVLILYTRAQQAVGGSCVGQYSFVRPVTLFLGTVLYPLNKDLPLIG